MPVRFWVLLLGKRRIAAFGVAKFTVLFSAAVYVLSLPFYWLDVVSVVGGGDALLPYEVAFCLILSVFLFSWSANTVWKLLKTIL